MIKDIKAKGIPVISEIEFAARFTNAKIIGITGSNGKTTTTKLTHHILANAGLNAGLAGNIGPSFARSIATETRDLYVLELSSFQLDGIEAFRPHIAMLLNISPDHLDRYEYQMQLYVQSKFRITKNQLASDHFLYSDQDEEIRNYLSNHPIEAIKVPVRFFASKSTKVLVDGEAFEMANSSLRGPHNYKNALFAIKTALLLGVEPEVIQFFALSYVWLGNTMMARRFGDLRFPRSL